MQFLDLFELTLILFGTAGALCDCFFSESRKSSKTVAGSNERLSDCKFKSSNAMLSRSDSAFMSVNRGKLWDERSSKFKGEIGPVDEALERFRERKVENASSW